MYNKDPYATFIPHLHLESMLAMFPNESEEKMIQVLNDTLEFFVTNDLATVSVDADGNFHYDLTKKGIIHTNKTIRSLQDDHGI